MRSKLLARIGALEAAASVAAVAAAPPLLLVREADGRVHDLDGREYSAEQLRAYKSAAPSLIVSFTDESCEAGSLANTPSAGSRWEPPKPRHGKTKRRKAR